jgi:hypothetical protein
MLLSHCESDEAAQAKGHFGVSVAYTPSHAQGGFVGICENGFLVVHCVAVVNDHVVSEF